MNLFLITDIIVFNKTIVLRAFSESELINSASEDENNGTEESQISDDEYLPDFTKLQPYMYEPCVSKESVKEYYPGKESSDSEKGTSRIENTLWCSFGKYQPMATHAERICCLNKYETQKSYFKGTLSFVFEIFLSSNLLLRRK